MCRSAAEAAGLAEDGFDDLLVAYPTIQACDLESLRSLHDAGKSVMLVVDGEEGLSALASAMKGARRPFPVVLELDVTLRLLGGALHLGARRSPVHDAEMLVALARRVGERPGLRFCGVMAYESFVAGVGDRNPFRRALNPLVGALRGLARGTVAEARKRARERLEANGLECEVFNGGGAASLASASREPWLTEVTAGSAFLCPHLSDYFSDASFEPACYFALQAVRRPSPGLVTCAGGGYVASGWAGADRLPRPWLPEGASLVSDEGCGEVQTPVRLPRPEAVPLGGPVFFRHAKAGELAEHFEEYLLVSGGRVVGSAKTYRGLGRGPS
jgi:D-serine deaminase-like pyridoxal phosphate-dependent protein